MLFGSNFKGRCNSDRIELADIFRPLDSVTFTAPYESIHERSKVLVECHPEMVDFLYTQMVKLPSAASNSLFGKWDGVVPEDDNTLVLIYKRVRGLSHSDIVELLTQVLYMDLAGLCKLKVSNNSTISVFKGRTCVMRGLVTLPYGIPNGSIEAPIILRPRNFIV